VVGDRAPDTDRRLVSLRHAMLLDGVPAARLVLIRHGQQALPPRGVAPASWPDPPLTETGLSQARAVSLLLASTRPSLVVSSDLSRARATAEAIRSRHDIPLVIDPRLQEVDVYAGLGLGAWPVDDLGTEGLSAAQDEFDRERRWSAFRFSETGAELRRRVTASLDPLALSHAGQTVIVVCHGGVINAYVTHLLGHPADMLFMPAHASVSRVLALADGRRLLESLNERQHLDGAGLTTY